MAVLGVQLIVTLLTISVMQKVTERFSFGKWLLCKTGLTYYLHPSDFELRKLAGIPQPKPKPKPKEVETKRGKNKRKQKEVVDDKTFTVPRNLDIQLESAKIFPRDVLQLKFFTEFVWLIDYCVFVLIVYIITEVYYGLMPKANQEVNLSMIWCLLLIGFALKSLCSVTGLYFRSTEAAAERSMVLVGGSFCFVLALGLLLIDESNLEIGLDAAYSAFNQSASVFLERQTLDSEGPASKLILKLCFAAWCAITGALFIFPGLRISRMHLDALRHCGERSILKVFIYINLVSPFLLCCLWIRPLARHYFTVRVFGSMEAPLMTDLSFDSMRLWLCIFFNLIRIVSAPACFQAYLNLAQERVDKLKKEAGRISNVDLQRKIAIIFYYLCVVGLQFIAPIVLCVGFTLMNKTMGGYGWFGIHHFNPDECNPQQEQKPVTLSNLLPSEEGSLSAVREQWLVAISSIRQIFSYEVYRGIFGFTNWWIQFLSFATVGFGLAYQSFLQDDV
uniref:EOG090X04CK n=1 Tax=Simocephalus serrulatus TaxID=117539 RepID=A0A4Y7NLU2_9CRUS|nr:EOG090X04CK [Simocephalus serrulatus]SVE94172.1 EOG090X04CK [Simocephalus serrulatus]